MSRKSEDRSRKSEDRSRKSEVGSRKSEVSETTYCQLASACWLLPTADFSSRLMPQHFFFLLPTGDCLLLTFSSRLMPHPFFFLLPTGDCLLLTYSSRFMPHPFFCLLPLSLLFIQERFHPGFTFAAFAKQRSKIYGFEFTTLFKIHHHSLPDHKFDKFYRRWAF